MAQIRRKIDASNLEMKKFGALEDEWQIKDSVRKTRHMQYSLVFSLYTIDYVKIVTYSDY